MILGHVTVRVTGSVSHPSYRGHPLYVVRPLDARGRGGRSFVALDTVGCALGDQVLVGRVPGLARQVLHADRAPVRSMILGILDGPPS